MMTRTGEKRFHRSLCYVVIKTLSPIRPYQSYTRFGSLLTGGRRKLETRVDRTARPGCSRPHMLRRPMRIEVNDASLLAGETFTFHTSRRHRVAPFPGTEQPTVQKAFDAEHKMAARGAVRPVGGCVVEDRLHRGIYARSVQRPKAVRWRYAFIAEPTSSPAATLTSNGG
jgi:hypothetical protein